MVWAQDCLTQSWRGHRIAPLNPDVNTGLPHSILAWAQDCPGVSQKTLEAQCCTALRPRLAARIARKTPAVCLLLYSVVGNSLIFPISFALLAKFEAGKPGGESVSALLHSRTLAEFSVSVLLYSSALP